jgi:hypothetical protein
MTTIIIKIAAGIGRVTHGIFKESMDSGAEQRLTRNTEGDTRNA